ncbi:MAG: hypothetical protein BroJett011_52010 [Chloroflexota bacterium]|nr:MAG: hypothetical protein BroJett011_52010 [Chloroflexota bacterium]
MQSMSSSKVERIFVSSDKQAIDEIIEFLINPQGGGRPDLPQAVIGYWEDAVAAYEKAEPDWNSAKTSCANAKIILEGLRRDSDTEIMEADRARGQILIFLGAIYLALRDISTANFSFEEAIIPLRSWSYKYFESLAHFGKAIALKGQQNWPKASEALQNALDAIRDDIWYIYNPPHLRSLEIRIKQEFLSTPIGRIEYQSNAYDTTGSEPTTSHFPSPIRISVPKDTGIRLGLIVEDDILILHFYFDKYIPLNAFYQTVLPIVEALDRINKALISLIKPQIEPNVISIENILFSSLEISLGDFIPETLEVIRQLIKDFKFRNMHEKRMAELEEVKARVEITGTILDQVLKLVAPDASPEERRSIANQIFPDLQFILRSVDPQKLLVSDKDKKDEVLTFNQTSVDRTVRQPRTTTPPTPSKFPPREFVQIPVVSDIAAGMGVIAEENIVEYLLLDDSHRNGADFGARVVGNSMMERGIFPGDIALIRQQPTVSNGEIAAVVIMTPKIEALGVLKRYFVVYKNRKDLAHWLLESSNSSSEHLVVIPSGADVEAIRDFYTKKIKAGKLLNPIEFYEDAEITIAGKYVGLVRKN